MACMAILRTGRTFYHLEIAQQQFYRAAQKFLTNCHAGPNGSEMVRVLQMRVGWLDGWLMEEQEKFSCHLDAGSAGEQSAE